MAEMGQVATAAPVNIKDIKDRAGELKDELEKLDKKLCAYKGALKAQVKPVKDALDTLPKMHAATERCQKQAESDAKVSHKELCEGLLGIYQAYEKRRKASNANVLQQSRDWVKKQWTDHTARLSDWLKKKCNVDPTHSEPAVSSIDKLWNFTHMQVAAAYLLPALSNLEKDIDRVKFLEDAIQKCRNLRESAGGLGKELNSILNSKEPTLQALTEAQTLLGHLQKTFADFEGNEIEGFKALKEKMAIFGELPKLDGMDWPKDKALPRIPGQNDVHHSEIARLVMARTVDHLQKADDDRLDEFLLVLECRNEIDPKMFEGGAAATRAEALDALRDATKNEWTDRYQTQPMKKLAELATAFQEAADAALANGRHGTKMTLPDQPDLYHESQQAIYRLLRGMCLAGTEESRAEYLSRLIFQEEDIEEREHLINCREWRDPDVFNPMMTRILKTVANPGVMESQYRRLMQEIQVVVAQRTLGPGERGWAGCSRPLEHFEKLEAAMPGKSRRGVLSNAWSKTKFWSKYIVYHGDTELQGARFDYHRKHVEKSLRKFFDICGRDKADPRDIRRAFRRFLTAGDDLRVELEAAQRPDHACDDYLYTEFSRAMSRLGTKSMKNLYKVLLSECPNVEIAPRNAVTGLFSGVRVRWRNAFHDKLRAMPRQGDEWQKMARQRWAELRATLEQEPEARLNTKLLAGLTDQFDRVYNKNYDGMKDALDKIIQSDGNTWVSPCSRICTAYESAWDRIDPKYGQRLWERLQRYDGHMDEFLKTDSVRAAMGKHRFMYTYVLEGLREAKIRADHRHSADGQVRRLWVDVEAADSTPSSSSSPLPSPLSSDPPSAPQQMMGNPA